MGTEAFDYECKYWRHISAKTIKRGGGEEGKRGRQWNRGRAARWNHHTYQPDPTLCSLLYGGMVVAHSKEERNALSCESGESKEAFRYEKQ